MSNVSNWLESAPVLGEQVESSFVEVPDAAVTDVWIASPRDCNMYGWTQRPGELAKPDGFKDATGWIGRDVAGVSVRPNPSFVKLANTLTNWARLNTFGSFRHSPLGIVIECSGSTWISPDHTDPTDLDTIPHLDWGDAKTPALIVIGAIGRPSIAYTGTYTYAGTSEANEDPLKYTEVAQELNKVPAQVDKLYAADVRRGLHARPVMKRGYSPFMRQFVRAFIAPRTDLSV